jgi:(1->4)-alpha-D-glucan 1-alpha-D-glucosylmutase
MNDTNPLDARIASLFPEMSHSQKELARYVLDNGLFVAYAPAAELGSKVGVSAATVVRFCQILGYDGYPELQRAVRESLPTYINRVERMEQGETLDKNHVLERVFRQDIENLMRTRESLDPDRFCDAVAALADASDSTRRYIDAVVRRFNGDAADPRSFDLLDQLLNEQSYRLAHWRVASEEINYRRFFDVNELAAVRMEDPSVFEEVHRFVFELLRRGAATGLRVDHVDGLYAPADYLCRLQRRAAGTGTDEHLGSSHAQGAGPAGSLPLFIVVEKILARDEQLPGGWPVHGTTGYEFAAVVNNLFVDARNERALTDIYMRFVHQHPSFADLAYGSKKHVMHETMSGDINSLGHQLNRFSERNRHYRDFTLYSLISTIKEVIACFPVYRTYVTADGPVSPADRRYITAAVKRAKRRAPAVTSVVFDFIEQILLKNTPAAGPDDGDERARIIGKFQQITSPVSAKGLEDTALYIYNRLLSLNEVGSDPTRFGLDVSAVHAWLEERRRRWPTALSTLSTHDTKRGEDARARLNVLSEIPGAWKAALSKWRAANRRFKTAVRGAMVPDANEEYLLYQALVGAWPFETDPETEAEFRRRVSAYLVKALREAKIHTGWLSPDEAYEAAVVRFADAILDRRRPGAFLPSFLPFQARVAELGIYNSLAQLAIKITAPGVPDFYQGTELWDFSFVDPDNRRSVDYRTRADHLAGCAHTESAANLLASRHDGRVKLFVAARGLAERARLRDVYERGEYIPMAAAGLRRDCVFAFARRLEDQIAVTCVPRMVASLVPDATMPPVGRSVWTDTTMELPARAIGAALGPTDATLCFRNVFTGAAVNGEIRDGQIVLPAAMVFETFPAAVLVRA